MSRDAMTSVLVVDDDEHVRAFLSELLRIDGFDVGVARGYIDAVKAAKRQRYDHVFIDFLYPEDPDQRDGIDVLQAVRRLTPTVRAYLMTGLAGNMPIEPIMAKGFDGFLAKPFSVEAVRSLLDAGHTA